MKNTKKELLLLIQETEKTIQANKNKLTYHQAYFTDLSKNKGLVAGLIVVPGVLLGWYAGKMSFRENAAKLKPHFKDLFIKLLKVIRVLYSIV